MRWIVLLKTHCINDLLIYFNVIIFKYFLFFIFTEVIFFLKVSQNKLLSFNILQLLNYLFFHSWILKKVSKIKDNLFIYLYLSLGKIYLYLLSIFLLIASYISWLKIFFLKINNLFYYFH